MTLNDTIKLPICRPLRRSDFLSMENILRGSRESGEIHIETTGTGLTLELSNQHHALNGTPLDTPALDRRGINANPTFVELQKIAITESKVVLFPINRKGRNNRKRTLNFFKRGWVSTKRAFFSDFTITDNAS